MLLSLLGLGAGTLLPRGLRASSRASGLPVERPARSPFEPDRRLALSAACERILPGAGEAGVMDHIDYWMGREPFSSFVRPLFKVGAIHLDRLSRQDFGKAYAHCQPEQQNALLARFQRGEIKARRFQSQAFFEHLLRFTLEGFLGDPKYGGNRGEVGWKLIGRSECWWQPRHMDYILRPDQGLPW